MAKPGVRSFLKDSFFYGIGDVLGRMIGIVMLPVLSRIFVPADYGSIDLLAVVYGFLLPGVTLNVSAGIMRYYYRLEGLERARLLSSGVSYPVFIAAGCGMAAWWSADTLSTLLQGTQVLAAPIRLLALCLPVEVVYDYMMVLLRLERMVGWFSGVNIARIVVVPLLTLVCTVLLHMGIAGVFAARLGGVYLLAAFLAWRLRSHFAPSVSLRLCLDMIRYALPGHPGRMIGQFMLLLPRYVLLATATLTDVGLFGVAMRLSQVVNLYNSAFTRAWSPVAFSIAGEDGEREFYGTVFKGYGFSLLLLVSSLGLFSREVLWLLTPVAYHQAYYLVVGVSLYRALRALAYLFNTALYTRNQVAKTSYLNLLLLLLFLPQGFWLASWRGAGGLVFAMNSAMLGYFVVYMRSARRYLEFPVPWLRLSLLAGAAAAGVWWFNMATALSWEALAVKFVWLTAWSVCGVLLLTTGQERRRCKRLVYDILQARRKR